MAVVRCRSCSAIYVYDSYSGRCPACGTATAAAVPAGVVATGTLSAEELGLSDVDDLAFLEPSGSLNVAEHIGRWLTVTDSAGSWLAGFLKAPGTASAFGPERVVNGGFDATTAGWTSIRAATLTSVSGGESGNCLEVQCDGQSSPAAEQRLPMGSVGALYQASCYVQRATATAFWLRTDFWEPRSLRYVSSYLSPSGFEWQQMVLRYGLPNWAKGEWLTLQISATMYSGKMGYFDTVSCRQVLAPGTGGAWVYKTRSGERPGWQRGGLNFDYADPAGYDYEVRDLP